MFVFNTPEHGNLGDQLIAFSMIKFLKDYYKDYRIYEINHSQYFNTKKSLKKKICKENLIFITGGGYLGDIWENEQEIVNDIITFFTNKIVIFPQTVYYKDYSSLVKHKDIYIKAKNLYIMLRDKKSYNMFINDFNYDKKKLLYAPDITLYLNMFKLPQIQRQGIGLCLRKDKEKSLDNLIDMESFNKIGYTCYITDTIVNKYISKRIRKKEIYLKAMEFSKYNLIITDRLHGMIFSYLTNTPCIALDNISKKVSGVYEWIDKCNYIKCIDEFNEVDLEKLLIDLTNPKFRKNVDNEDLINYFNSIYLFIDNIL